jgi:hypothetical protein
MTTTGGPAAPDDGAIVWPDRPRLGRLVDALGTEVLHAACAPRGLDVLVCDLVVHDPDDSLYQHPGALLLAVGARADDPGTAATVRAAGHAGYCAVIVKDRGADLDALVAAAVETGIALLVTPEDMPWRHLDSLLTAAMSAPGTAATPYASVGIGDLFALANAIASNVGGATAVEDPHGQVLAYSNLSHQKIDEIRKQAILGRKTPDRATNRSEYHRVSQAPGAYHFDSLGSGHTARLAIAVWVGGQLLGYLWTLDGEPPLGPDAPRALEEAARVAALHLMRSRGRDDPYRWQRSEALRAILDGGTTGRAATARLGLAPETSTVVIAFAPAVPDPEPGLTGARVSDLVSLYCQTWHTDAICATSWGGVYALIPVPPGVVKAKLVRFATEIASTVQKSARLNLHVGIGPVATRLDGVAESRRMADRVVEVLADTGGGEVRVATEEQVRSRIALLDLAGQGVADGEALLAPVRRLVGHDAEHGTTHATTLLAFLDAFGEAARAAKALSVHENTLRYRIRRLEELFDLDLADPADRLVIWLQLRLLQIRSDR